MEQQWKGTREEQGLKGAAATALGSVVVERDSLRRHDERNREGALVGGQIRD